MKIISHKFNKYSAVAAIGTTGVLVGTLGLVLHGMDGHLNGYSLTGFLIGSALAAIHIPLAINRSQEIKREELTQIFE